MQILTPNFATTIATHAAVTGGEGKRKRGAASQIAEKIEHEIAKQTFAQRLQDASRVNI